MSHYSYCNAAGQRFPLRERPLEPPADVPLRYCTRCLGEIYSGSETLCDYCLEEVRAEGDCEEEERKWMSLL